MKRKTYYKVCPYCNAHLDPGERCDCQTNLIEEPMPTAQDHTAA